MTPLFGAAATCRDNRARRSQSARRKRRFYHPFPDPREFIDTVRAAHFDFEVHTSVTIRIAIPRKSTLQDLKMRVVSDDITRRLKSITQNYLHRLESVPQNSIS